MGLKLGIVGNSGNKFTPETALVTKILIEIEIKQRQPSLIISGHCPLGGVDIWAEEIANSLHIPTLIHAPKSNQWSVPGGYRDRNLSIARDSDLVLCFVVSHYYTGYPYKKYKSCYHCGKRNPPHVKSGGCYTAWRCKEREWIII